VGRVTNSNEHWIPDDGDTTIDVTALPRGIWQQRLLYVGIFLPATSFVFQIPFRAKHHTIVVPKAATSYHKLY
jgi:hypothetical protein